MLSKNSLKSIWLLFTLLVILFTLLFLQLIWTYQSHAAACLSIDVPPQAVLDNHDGDTFRIFTFGPGGSVVIRVQDIDTPEISMKKGVPDEPGAQEAKEFTRQWLSVGTFTVVTCGKHTLERIVATVARNGTTLASALRAAGYAKPPK